jgi:hypothetical protein
LNLEDLEDLKAHLFLEVLKVFVVGFEEKYSFLPRVSASVQIVALEGG